MGVIPPVVVASVAGDSNNVVSTTLTIAKPPDVRTGDILVAALRCGSSAQTTDYALTGWTRRAYSFVASSATARVTGLYTHYVSDASSEPSSYVFALAGNAFARQSGIITVVRPGAGATPWGTEPAYMVSPSFNGGPPPYPLSFGVAVNSLVLYCAANETVSPGIVAATPPTGTTLIDNHGSLTNQGDTSTTRSVVSAFYEVATTNSGAGAGKSVGYPSYSSPVEIALAIPGTPPTTLPNKFANVSSFLATVGATIAHRGGSAAYAEMAKDSYTKAVARGFSAFEFSCGWSSDLVPFGLADQYLDRTALNAGTTTLDPTTLTWASISGTYQNVLGTNGPQPYYRLVDFLDDFRGSGVCLVDPKFGFATPAKITALLDICDAHGGPTKILIKFDSPTADTQLSIAARARGYVCLNYWGTDTTSLAAQQANWDVLGLAHDAGSSPWAQLKSYGKKVWAAVIPSNAAYQAAIVNDAADLYMVQDTDGITPVGPVSATSGPYPVKLSPPQLVANWSARSLLTPISSYSISDHMLAAYRREHPADVGLTLDDFISRYGY